MTDTASESGSSCSSRLMDQELAPQGREETSPGKEESPQEDAPAPGKEDLTAPTGTVATPPGKVVPDDGAGATEGATGGSGAAVSNIERLLQQQRK